MDSRERQGRHVKAASNLLFHADLLKLKEVERWGPENLKELFLAC